MLGQIVSTLIQNRSQKKAQEREFKNNKEMWNLANQYNTPEMQMERLRDAGLNPNLVYGTGAVGNTSTQTPKYQAPNLQRIPLEVINPLNVLGAFADLKQKNAQADKARSEADWIDSQKVQQVVKTMLDNKALGELIGAKGWQAKRDDKRNKSVDLRFEGSSQQLLKSQAEVKGKEMDNALKKFQVEFMKKVPKSMQWALPLLFNAVKSVR